MPNKPKATDGSGNFWCPGCKSFLSIDNFHTLKKTKTKKSFYGIQSWCKVCQREFRLKWHSKPESALRYLVRRAAKRKLEFNLYPDWAIKQFQKQKGKCFYTNIPMTFTQGKGRVWSNASIDRVDSDKGYTIENCVLCCCGFNLMKTNLSIDAIGILCKAFIAKQNETS